MPLIQEQHLSAARRQHFQFVADQEHRQRHVKIPMKLADGAWKLVVDIWNSPVPLADPTG